MNTEAMIRLYDISKHYRSDSAALANIDLRIDKGEFVYLTGASGAGKSTLLKLLFCAERPDKGQILIKGRNITRLKSREVPYLRRTIGVVFQDYKLMNSRTIFENVAFPLEVQGKRRIEVGKKVYQALKEVGLEERMSRYPLELSGGEQQRIAIARALVVGPDILLADEPTGNLDINVTLEIMELFKKANARGTTVVLATHSQEMIQRFPRRVLTLEGGALVRDESC